MFGTWEVRGVRRRRGEGSCLTVIVTAGSGLSWGLTRVKTNFSFMEHFLVFFRDTSSVLFHCSDSVDTCMSPTGLLLPSAHTSGGALQCPSLVRREVSPPHPSGRSSWTASKTVPGGLSFLRPTSGPWGTHMHPLSMQPDVWVCCNAAASCCSQPAIFSPLRYFRHMSDTSPRCSPSFGQGFSTLALLIILCCRGLSCAL